MEHLKVGGPSLLLFFQRNYFPLTRSFYLSLGPGEGQILWTGRRSLQSGHFIDVKNLRKTIVFTMKNDDSIIEDIP